jgi:hypothetical protein
MKPQQTTKARWRCSANAVKWGRPEGYGIALGKVLGTVVGVATKNYLFVYLGMFLGAASAAIAKMQVDQNG